MTAPDMESARSIARGHGFKIIELIQLAERMMSATYRPSLADRFELWERSRAWKSVFLLLAVLGLGWTIALEVHSHGTSSKPEAPAIVRIHLSGTVGVPEALRDNALLVFYFPEIPMTLNHCLTDVADRAGTYSVELELKAPKKPTHFSLTMLVDAKPLASTPQLALTGNPLAGNADLNFRKD